MLALAAAAVLAVGCADDSGSAEGGGADTAGEDGSGEANNEDTGGKDSEQDLVGEGGGSETSGEGPGPDSTTDTTGDTNPETDTSGDTAVDSEIDTSDEDQGGGEDDVAEVEAGDGVDPDTGDDDTIESDADANDTDSEGPNCDCATVQDCVPPGGLAACQLASCEAGCTCTYSTAPDGLPCDDGKACTTSDICGSGICAGQTNCDDGNPCTADICSATLGCQHLPVAAPCEDGNLCFGGDLCSGGACVGGSVPVACDDGNVCTNDTCNPLVGCVFEPSSGTPCSDGQACNGAETCVQGQCPAGPACPCQTDAQCPDDGDLCNGISFCQNNTCAISSPVVCQGPTSACSKDLCNPATGQCEITPVGEGTACDDGNACTGPGICTAGACLTAPLQCHDGNPCAIGICVPASGCVLEPADGAPCDDGNACTDADQCQELECHPGTQICPADYCCEALDEAGCPADPDLEGCVCASDSFCCEVVWDALCAEEAAVGCGHLPCLDLSALCCAPSFSGGCADPDIEGCVCSKDPECCTNAWTSACAALAVESCELTCDGPCCSPGDTAGCAESAECQACVCSFDSFCCTGLWDDECAFGAQQLCSFSCGCGVVLGETSCCDESESGGCAEALCQDCICALDSFCCDTAWDEVCAICAQGGDCLGPGIPTPCAEFCGCEPPLPPCCEPSSASGCSDPVCEACVCGLDPICCNLQWDGYCAEVAVELCVAACGCTGPGNSGSCCIPSATYGCGDEDCTSCVCALDPFCCDVNWDNFCVTAAAEDCDATCQCPSGSGEGSCCAANAGAGCESAGCEACVCTIDAFCCNVQWDAQCANRAFVNCIGVCGCDPGDCCTPNDTPLCNNVDCSNCVCSADPFCCESMWDEFCVECASGGQCDDTLVNCASPCGCLP